MALYFCKNANGTSIVDDINKIETKHVSTGSDPKTIPLYIFSDGKRKGVATDVAGSQQLIYTNTQIVIDGVTHILQNTLPPSKSSTTVELDSTEGYGIGTILKSKTERMRVEQVVSKTRLLVTRDYNEGGMSVIAGHDPGDRMVAETTAVSLALPLPNDYDKADTFLSGGEPLIAGLNPTVLLQAVDDRETTNIIKCGNGTKYHVDCLIKIDNEIMKVTAINGNDLTVRRGWEGTVISRHDVTSIDGKSTLVYLFGIANYLAAGETDVNKTHKIFLKVQPPSGIPTQRKSDVRLSLISDENPL